MTDAEFEQWRAGLSKYENDIVETHFEEGHPCPKCRGSGVRNCIDDCFVCEACDGDGRDHSRGTTIEEVVQAIKRYRQEAD